jgi:peptidoglycan/xylan/chitin deacetylase (PgdA/CDA1 family)
MPAVQRVPRPPPRGLGVTARKPLLLSFDAEEFDLPAEFGRPLAPKRQLDATTSGIDRLLPVLAGHGVRATFFVTGALARARPASVRALAAAGHEVAVHGLDHADDYGRIPEPTAIARLRAARAIVEATSGQAAEGIRTPRLLCCPAARLRAAGFAYDASLHPTWVPGRYNRIRDPRHPWHDDGILRLPISVIPVVRWPVSFVWYRAAGALLGRWMAHLAASGSPYLHLYFHPWEAVDIRPLGVPRWLAFRTGDRFLAALDDLLTWSVPRYRCIAIGTFARLCRASPIIS